MCGLCVGTRRAHVDTRLFVAPSWSPSPGAQTRPARSLLWTLLLPDTESFQAAALLGVRCTCLSPRPSTPSGLYLFLQLKEERPWEPEPSKLPRSKMLRHSRNHRPHSSVSAIPAQVPGRPELRGLHACLLRPGSSVAGETLCISVCMCGPVLSFCSPQDFSALVWYSGKV